MTPRKEIHKLNRQIIQCHERYHGLPNDQAPVTTEDAIHSLCSVFSAWNWYNRRERFGAELLWNRYLADGWMVAEVLAIDDEERLVLFYRRCLDHGRFDLLRRVVNADRFNYRSFLKALACKTQASRTPFFTPHCRHHERQLPVALMFLDWSRVRIILPAEYRCKNFSVFGLVVTYSRRTIYDFQHNFHLYMPVLAAARVVDVDDMVKLRQGCTNRKAELVAMQTTELVEVARQVNETHESVCALVDSTRLVPTLRQTCRSYVRDRIMGPQLSVKRLVEICWAMGFPHPRAVDDRRKHVLWPQ